MLRRPEVPRAERLVNPCEGCLLADYEHGTCTVFREPAYQHRGGRSCWGRCDSVAEICRRLRAITVHVKSGSLYEAAWNELRDWEMVEKLAGR